MRQSMKRFHVYDMAATSLFVASKVEENTRRIKDFINACAQKASKNDKLTLEEGSKDYMKWKDTMLCNEVILLETLCFDLTIEHPHMCLLEFQNQLNVSGSILRKAWMILYQSCGSPLCVLYSPKIVAGAALLLAGEFSSESLDDMWWNQIDLDGSVIHEIASDMLSYYLEPYAKRSSSTVNSPYRSNSSHQSPTNNNHSYTIKPAS
ncbi:unnamed protein product [Cunninghamella blakesleeana]